MTDTGLGALPQARSITQRKRLAQDARNQLDAFRRLANDGDGGVTHLLRAAKLIADLRALQGVI